MLTDQITFGLSAGAIAAGPPGRWQTGEWQVAGR